MSKAFIGESMARNRYTMYAKIAQKEGLEQIAAIFLETADQEREHAKWLFRHINELKEGDADIEVPAGVATVLGTTAENLKAAIAGENHEHTSMYPEYAGKAKEEGQALIAARLLSIAKAEEHHEQRYQQLLEEVEAKTTHKKAEETQWVCRKCGYAHTGTDAPAKCPACGHETPYFQVRSEKY